MTKLKIKVTKEILRKSMMCDWNYRSTSCAVSLAIRDILPIAEVCQSVIAPWGGAKFDCLHSSNGKFKVIAKNLIALPKAAQDYIIEFDNRWSEPEKRLDLPEIEFEIKLPESVINQIDISSITKLLENHPSLQLINV